MSTVNLTLYDDHKQVVQSYKKYYCYGPLGDPTTSWTFCRASPTSPPNKEYLKWLQQSPLAEYYQGDIIKKLSYKKELGTAFVIGLLMLYRYSWAFSGICKLVLANQTKLPFYKLIVLAHISFSSDSYKESNHKLIDESVFTISSVNTWFPNFVALKNKEGYEWGELQETLCQVQPINDPLLTTVFGNLTVSGQINYLNSL